MSFSDHSPITLAIYTSRLKDVDTKTYRDTSFLKSILIVDSFNQEISKWMQKINYSEKLDECFHQFELKHIRILDQFAPFRSSCSKKKS